MIRRFIATGGCPWSSQDFHRLPLTLFLSLVFLPILKIWLQRLFEMPKLVTDSPKLLSVHLNDH